MSDNDWAEEYDRVARGHGVGWQHSSPFWRVIRRAVLAEHENACDVCLGLAKYEIRAERHPDDPDKSGGLE